MILRGFRPLIQTIAPEVCDIVLIDGQSNALGRNQNQGWDIFPASYKIPIPNAYINYAYDNPPNNFSFTTLNGLTDSVSYRYRYVGVQYALAKAYTEYKGKSLYIVHYAVGSTGLLPDANFPDWSPSSGELYTNLVQRIKQAISTILSMGKIPRIVSMYWNQGENDANVGVTQLQYYNALTGFFSSLLNEPGITAYCVGGANLNLQLSKLRHNTQPTNGNYNANVDLVRAAQVQFATARGNVGLIEEDDLEYYSDDTLHLKTYPSQFTMGQRLFDNIKNIA